MYRKHPVNEHIRNKPKNKKSSASLNADVLFCLLVSMYCILALNKMVDGKPIVEKNRFAD